MSSDQSHPDVRLVDSVEGIADLLSVLQGASVLYMDLEGVNLGRKGSLSIMTIYDNVDKTIFAIDILVLKDSAFNTKNDFGNSLKAILETPRIAKVFFDVRNDSDALFTHYQTSLQGVRDVQLMELAARQGSREFVHSLARCIENDAPLSSKQRHEWKESKEKLPRSNPSKINAYEIFNKRPLEQHVLRYCAGDVVHLPALLNLYWNKLSVEWREKVQTATEDRIRLSQSPNYDPLSTSKVRGPWLDTSLHTSSIDTSNERFDQIEQDFFLNPNIKYDTSNERFDQIEQDFFLNPDNDDYGDLDDYMDRDNYEYDDWDDWDPYGDTARDCIGWEDDMVKNGSPF